MDKRAPKASDAAKPLYAQIEQALREAIVSGEHPVGSLLPAETDLCAHFNVSRYTVREALRRLTENGLVARRQGAGTVVISNQNPRVFVQSARSLDELFQYAVDTRLVVERTAMVVLAGADASLIGADEGSSWLRIDGVRRDAAGQPICTVTVFVAEPYAAVADEVAGIKGSIFGRIEERWGLSIVDVVQEIGAGVMPPDVAQALGTKRQAVGMRFRRSYSLQDGTLVLTSINWHPAERFVYATRMKRSAD
ncbi:MAG: GntR family transcriptional regulator [Beijerinckiaceae bacterium]|jgi:DNA-binding GntR family transcriptional regulator|nr:GntR family transcriptional regulator [Beijerinckiaceae bacterium]